MRRKIFTSLILLFIAFAIDITVSAQNAVNWTQDQLIEAASLAQVIRANKDLPSIISVGPGASIPHSVEIGPIKDEDSFVKFKQHLSKLDKNTSVVIYCGCCPFEHCPNVRPAVATLREMEFTNYRLLNIPKNLKVDWIDKGYPVTE